jgi:hypothetical protein
VPPQLRSNEHAYRRLVAFLAALKTSEEKERRVCVKHGEIGADTFEILKAAFGDECLSRAGTFKWLNFFKGGQTQSMTIRDPGDRRQAWKELFRYEYVPEGQTVNQHYCVEDLRRLRLALCRKRPKKRESRAWALHHDNAPAQTAHSFQALFWQIMAFLWFSNHPTPLTWLPVTSRCFQT